MTTPTGDDRPTTVLPQATVEQPSVATAPATRRARVWRRKLPPRLGRARTSTVVIGCLFVLLFALNSTLPTADGGTVPVSYNGRTIDVPVSALPSDARPTSTPTPTPTPTSAAPATTEAPAPTTSAAPTSRTPRTTATDGDDETGTTAPTTTGESGRRSTAPATTSRAPATTTQAPESSQPAESSAESTATATATG
jgi:hypothetical protein